MAGKDDTTDIPGPEPEASKRTDTAAAAMGSLSLAGNGLEQQVEDSKIVPQIPEPGQAKRKATSTTPNDSESDGGDFVASDLENSVFGAGSVKSDREASSSDDDDVRVTDEGVRTTLPEAHSKYITNRSKFAKELGLSKAALTVLLCEDEDLEEVLEEVLPHVRQTPDGDGSKQGRGRAYAAIKARIDRDKPNQFSKYIGARARNKKTWETEDWLAYATLTMRQTLMLSAGGALSGKGLTFDESIERSWIMWKLKVVMVGNKREAAMRELKKQNDNAARKQVAMRKRAEKKSLDNAVAAATYGEPVAQPTPRKRQKQKSSGATPRGGLKKVVSGSPSDSEEEVDLPRVPMWKIKKADKEIKKLVADHADLFAEWANADATKQKPLTSMDVERIMADFDKEMAKMDEERRVRLARRKAKAAKSTEKFVEALREDPDRLDLHKRISTSVKNAQKGFIKDFNAIKLPTSVINRVLRPYGHKDEIATNTEIADPVVERDVHEEQRMGASLARNEDVDVVKAAHKEDEADEEKVSTMELPEVTEDELERNRIWMATLNSAAFQEDDIVGAMIYCRIVSSDYKFLPHQKPNKPLRWWQLCAILWSFKVRIKNGGLGGICADAIGTGKTKTMLGIALMCMVEDSEAIVAAADKGDERFPAKPWAVFLPPSLIDQFIQEARSFSNFFKLFCFGETTFTISDGVTKLNELTASNPLFDTAFAHNARALVVISEHTYALNNGTAGAITWMRETHNLPNKWQPTPPYTEERTMPQELAQWPCNMERRFRGVLIDEAQNAFRNFSSFWTMVQWTRPTYKYLFSGSPTPRGLADLPALIAQVEGEELARKAVVGDPERGYRHGDNPYEMASTEPAAMYRASTYCFKKFILHNDNLSGYDKAREAQKLLEYYLLRRDYSSACPIGSNRTIARNIPACHIFNVIKIFSPTATEVYEACADEWIPRSFTTPTDKFGRSMDPVPNPRTIRTLALSTVFPLLHYLDIPNPKYIAWQKEKKELQDAINAAKGGGDEDSDGDYVDNEGDAQELQEKLEDLENARATDPEYNRDKYSWFNDESEIFKEMPPISHHLTRLRWLLAKIKEQGCPHIPALEYQNRSKVSSEKVLDVFLLFSPKVQALLSIGNEYAVLREEKIVVWFNYPFVHQLVQEILIHEKLTYRSIKSETPTEKRSFIQAETNNPDVRFHFLLAQQKVGGVGLDFQHDMRIAVIFDQADSLDEQAQIVGRVWRLGQALETLIFDLVVENTVDTRRLTQQLSNAVEGKAMLMSHAGAVNASTNPDFKTKTTDDLERYFVYQKTIHHLDSDDGRKAINAIREADGHPEDWLPATLPAAVALTRLLEQNHAKAFRQHGGTGKTSTKSLRNLVETEIFQRKLRRDAVEKSPHTSPVSSAPSSKAAASQETDPQAPRQNAFYDEECDIYYPNAAYYDSLTSQGKGKLTKGINKQRKAAGLGSIQWKVFFEEKAEEADGQQNDGKIDDDGEVEGTGLIDEDVIME